MERKKPATVVGILNAKQQNSAIATKTSANVFPCVMLMANLVVKTEEIRFLNVYLDVDKIK